jgi:citrate lyase beta subunit
MISQAAIRARSWLFTPATRPDRFAKAAADGADVAILDLEDAVAPKDKAEARTTALNYLAGNPSDGALHALRINGLDTLSGISDLDALLGSSAAPNFVVLPKTETAGHLQILDRLLTAAGKDTRLIGLIESAHGLAAVEAIATATPRLTGLMLGAPMRQRAENRSSPQPRRPRTARFRASCRGFKGRSRLRASTRTYIVTEFGSANLKGLSSTERAHALIGLAHPEFRDELLASAKKLHLV